MSFFVCGCGFLWLCHFQVPHLHRNTHTHTFSLLSLSLSLCVCVCVSMYLPPPVCTYPNLAFVRFVPALSLLSFLLQPTLFWLFPSMSVNSSQYFCRS